MGTTLVDVSAGAEFDVFVGRERLKSTDERLWHTHPLSAPYTKHNGNPYWKDDAKDDYRALLNKKLTIADSRHALESLIGMRIGVWGDWGMKLGEILLKVINQLEAQNGNQ